MDTEQVFVKERVRCSSEKWCKHYAGIDHSDPGKKCDAGVLMSSVTVDRPYKYRYGEDRGPAYTENHSYPCFTDGDPHGVCSCDKREFPTQEEKDAAYAEIMGGHFKVMQARDAIVKVSGGARGSSGVMPCPICGEGMLKYSIASANGHVHAACSTASCVRWME